MANDYEMLFDYLKDILYSPEKAFLNSGEVSEEAEKLAEGLRYLHKCIKEEKTFSKAIARGDLSVQPPEVDNVLAAPTKELQGAFRHLTWQTKQIAKGDYSQRVDFMGEFSDSFNTMTEQLKDRSEKLLVEKEKVEEKNRELEKSLELVMALTYHTHNMIFVFSEEKGEELFLNHPAEWHKQIEPESSDMMIARLKEKEHELSSETFIWEMQLDGEVKQFYLVESYSIPWNSEKAFVHIVTDDTERKNREALIYQLAYTDPLTGLCNRRHAYGNMQKWIADEVSFVLSFIDIDYLKYCNDTFGHKVGDDYLIKVSRALSALGGVLCRVGGDEFFLLQENTTIDLQNDRLRKLCDIMRKENKEEYPCGFSFASVLIPQRPELSLEAYIREADRSMYQHKLKNRLYYGELPYRDDRMDIIDSAGQ